MSNNNTAPVVDFATPELQLEDVVELDHNGDPEPEAEFLQDLGLHLTISMRDGYTAATRVAVLRIVGAWIARHPDLAAAEIFEGEEPYEDDDHYGDDPTSFIGVRGAVAPLPCEQDLISGLDGELIAMLTAAGIAVQPCEREFVTRSGEEAGQFYPDGVVWFGRPEPIGPLIPALDVWGDVGLDNVVCEPIPYESEDD